MAAQEESEFSLSEEEDDGEDSSSSDGALDDDTELNLSKKKKKLTKKDKGEYRCEWPGCGRAFNKPSRLKEHQYSHTGQVMFILFISSSFAYVLICLQRPFVCTTADCGKSFKRKAHLQAHERSHTGLKDFM